MQGTSNGTKNVDNNSDKNDHNLNYAITKIVLAIMTHNDINTNSFQNNDK